MENIPDCLFEKYCKNQAWIDRMKGAIEGVNSLGYEIIHKYDDGYPMLLGGHDLYSRKGNLLMAYDVIDGFLTLQCNKENFFDWGGDFICKHYPAVNLIYAYKQII